MNKANINKIRSVLTTAIRVEAKGNRQDADHFLKQVKKNVEALIEQNRLDALAEGLARIDLSEPKELAPTKAIYIVPVSYKHLTHPTTPYV